MIRLGVVGTGWITDKFIDATTYDKRYKLCAVCSRSIETAKAFGSKYDVKLFFDDLELMCKSGEVDAIYIGSPNVAHKDQAIICLKNKIHTIVEKPMASNYREAEEMVKVAKENNVVLMEALRLTPGNVFKAVKENLEKIGPIRKYNGMFCQYSSKYERFLNGENFSSLSSEAKGGSLMDIGCYIIYPMVCLFGAPKSVTAFGTLLRTGVDGDASFIAQYDGLVASGCCSKIVSNNSPTEIMGEKGTIVIENHSDFARARLLIRGKDPEILAECGYKNDMAYEAIEFANVIQSGKLESDINSHFASLETMRILDKCRCDIGVPIE